MAKTSTDCRYLTADAVTNSLRIQGIAFRGPFCTPGKRIVFVVEKYIFLESELFELLAQNKLDQGGIRELAKRIDGMKSRQ
jgi:hypothetical protein